MSEAARKHAVSTNYSKTNSTDDPNSEFYNASYSPPSVVVDSTPLQIAMDKNKESLKVKLMVRRPHSQLVEQGILPPLKTSPAIHEQCKQLERAKTSDLLKAKIQRRPNRKDLERRHILEEDECNIDPSLAEKQRMLKKARLADQLNSQIQHRPGPLELIKKNILHTDKSIEEFVKEGLIKFKATSEGLITRPQHPISYVNFEESSQSSEGDTKPQRLETIDISKSSNDFMQIVSSPPFAPEIVSTSHSGYDVTVSFLSDNKSKLTYSKGHSAAGSTGYLTSSPISSNSNTLSPLVSIPQALNLGCTTKAAAIPIVKSDAPGKDKNRKKSKSKPAAKTRIIKFHEYKGPPNAALKTAAEETNTEETSYQLMLEQQNCLLKYLETLNKNQTITPAVNTVKTIMNLNVVSSVGKSDNSSITNTLTMVTANSSNNLLTTSPLRYNASIQSPNSISLLNSSNTSNPQAVVSACLQLPQSSKGQLSQTLFNMNSDAKAVAAHVGALEKMRVSDLKVHLKRRNLPVSGSKPQLIDRLKPYLPLHDMNNSLSKANEDLAFIKSDTEAMGRAIDKFQTTAGHQHCDAGKVITQKTIGDFQPQSATIILSNDEYIREQQREINELKRQLQKSQKELEEIRQTQQQQLPQSATPQLTNKLPAQLTDVATISTAVISSPLNTPVKSANTIASASNSQCLEINASITNTQNNKQTINQKMKFKQQLEAKIQKQRQAEVAAASELNTTLDNSIRKDDELVEKSTSAASANNTKLACNGFTDDDTRTIGNPVADAKHKLEFVWNDGNQTIYLIGLNKDHINLSPKRTGGKKILNGYHKSISLSAQSDINTTTNCVSDVIQHEERQQQTVESRLNDIKVNPSTAAQQLQRLHLQQRQQHQSNHNHAESDVNRMQNILSPEYDMNASAVSYDEVKRSIIHETDSALKAENLLSNCSTMAESVSKADVSAYAKSPLKKEELLGTALESILSDDSIILNAGPNVSSNKQPSDANAAAHNSTFIAKNLDSCTAAPVRTSATSQSYDFHPANSSYHNNNNTDHRKDKISDSSEPASKVNQFYNINFIDKLAKGWAIYGDGSSSSNDQPANVSTQQQAEGIESNVGVLLAEKRLPQLYSSTESSKANHFDEFELLELMSQHLEMDVEHNATPLTLLASHNNNTIVNTNNTCRRQYHHSNDKTNRIDCLADKGSCNNLPHSTSDAAYIHANDNHNISNSFNIAFGVSAASSQLKSNNLLHFDIDSFIQHSMPTYQHNLTITSPSPMDVCEDSENFLSALNISSISSDSTMNTPPPPPPPPAQTAQPHSQSQTHSFDFVSSCFALPDSDICCINRIPHSVCNTAVQPTPASSSAVTAFTSTAASAAEAFLSSPTENFDFFNIDDYKMCWSEGDFVV